MTVELNDTFTEEEVPTKEDSVRINEFFNLLTSEGYYDENCLKKLKEDALYEHENNDGILCSDIRVLEYHTSYVNFLPFLKNGNDFDLKVNFKDNAKDYLNSMYQNSFEYLKIKDIIENFRIEIDTAYLTLNGRQIKNIAHKVKFESNGIEYEDKYDNLLDYIKKHAVEPKDFFYNYLISNKSINYLLADINSPKRFIISRFKNMMKTYSMNIETAKYFDIDICFADSYEKIESVLDKFSKNEFLEKLTTQTKQEIIKKYRIQNPQIVLPTILVFSNTSKIKKYKIFDFEKNEGDNWNKLVEILSKGEFKLTNYKDNINDYKAKLEQLNKGNLLESFIYKFEYEFNDKLVKKELLITKEDRFIISEKKIFNLVFVELNKHLQELGNQRQFYFDGYNYLYYLNKKEIKFLKSEGLVYDLFDPVCP